MTQNTIIVFAIFLYFFLKDSSSCRYAIKIAYFRGQLVGFLINYHFYKIRSPYMTSNRYVVATKMKLITLFECPS